MSGLILEIDASVGCVPAGQVVGHVGHTLHPPRHHAPSVPQGQRLGRLHDALHPTSAHLRYHT